MTFTVQATATTYSTFSLLQPLAKSFIYMLPHLIRTVHRTVGIDPPASLEKENTQSSWVPSRRVHYKEVEEPG